MAFPNSLPCRGYRWANECGTAVPDAWQRLCPSHQREQSCGRWYGTDIEPVRLL